MSVAWGDVDGDGDLDLAVGNLSDVNQLYRNDGNGNFTAPPENTGSNSTTRSVAWGDADGDGDLDLAVGNSTQANQLYRNDGSGGFTSEDIGPNKSTYSLAWGDVDGDGDLDLAVGNWNNQINQLYRNDGSGGLTSEGIGAENVPTSSVAWGDADGDGDLDLAVGNAVEVNQLHRNDGIVGLTVENIGAEQQSTYSVAWGDADGDGDLDLAVGNQSGTNQLYRNNGSGRFTSPVNFSPATSQTRSVAWGDVEGDGDLDLAVGNDGQRNRLYRNNGSGGFTGEDIGSDTRGTYSLAWGDVDGDGDLDLAVGNGSGGEVNQLYLNNGSGGFTPKDIGSSARSTRSVAWGDADGDGDLDLAVGNISELNQLYRNDGSSGFTKENIGIHIRKTTSVAWGDADGDGDLDLAVGNAFGQVNQLYRNDGSGNFTVEDIGPDTKFTESVAWGDADGDGDLDLAVGNGGIDQVNQLYRNDGNGGFSIENIGGTDVRKTTSVAWGDVDGDGDLDLAAGNASSAPANRVNRLYRKGGEVTGGLTNNAPYVTVTRPITTAKANFYSTPILLDNRTIPLTYTLFDPEGDRIGGIAAFYSLDGGDNWQPAVAASGTVTTNLTTGRQVRASQVYTPAQDIPNTGSPFTVTLPVSGSGTIVDLDVSLSISHTLDADLQVALVSPADTQVTLFSGVGGSGQGFLGTVLDDQAATPINSGTAPFTGIYRPQGSLAMFNGQTLSGTWRLVITDSSDGGNGSLATWGLRLETPAMPHVYTWDTFTSGFFGQSDNVVVRLEAYSQSPVGAITGTYRYPNRAAGSYQWPYAAATTFPFRVRGTQIRVLSDTTPAANALVYRLPKDQSTGGFAMGDTPTNPFTTDSNGYLRGRGQINFGDRLLALAPVPLPPTYTERYNSTMHLYYTNASPTDTGLDADTVSQPGLQELTVSADHPLLLFDLDLSLEWDASYDPSYLDQLEFDLKKASQHLYDFTNGQVALGNITVYQNADDWAFTHIDVRATNNLRPFATIGGIVFTDTADINPSLPISYGIGQVHMGSTWNRYGTPGQSLGEDWPLILAHELSHYLLYLDDTYLGLNEHDLLIAVNSCTGSAMGDVYDVNNTEFVNSDTWLPNCQQTLAHQLLGRSEWDTIELWYPWLKKPDSDNSGPNLMPFDLTTVEILEPVTPTNALVDPTFYLDYQDGSVSSSGAQAYLLRDDQYVFPLGSPVGGQNRLLARGAQPGDRLLDTLDPTDPGQFGHLWDPGQQRVQHLGSQSPTLSRIWRRQCRGRAELYQWGLQRHHQPGRASPRGTGPALGSQRRRHPGNRDRNKPPA
jgi:subtilisin-like proprotein convertase family protein